MPVTNLVCASDLFLKVANPSLQERITAAYATGMRAHARAHTHAYTARSALPVAANLWTGIYLPYGPYFMQE